MTENDYRLSRLVNFVQILAPQYLEKLFEIELSYFKFMLTITTGSIFVSASFIDSLVDLQVAEKTWMLVTSWVFYCLNIAWLCYGIIFTAKYKDDVVGSLYDFILNLNEIKLGEESNKIAKRTFWLYFNVAFSIFIFLLGSAFILAFIYINLR